MKSTSTHCSPGSMAMARRTWMFRDGFSHCSGASSLVHLCLNNLCSDMMSQYSPSIFHTANKIMMHLSNFSETLIYGMSFEATLLYSELLEQLNAWTHPGWISLSYAHTCHGNSFLCVTLRRAFFTSLFLRL